MIERHWTGIAKVEESDNYVKHLYEDTFPALVRLDGFINATILKRIVPGGIEFRIVTIWESYESIKAFAGEYIGRAVVPDIVQNMMVHFDNKVSHYEVVVRQKS